MRKILITTILILLSSASLLLGQIIRGLPYNHAIAEQEHTETGIPEKAATAPIQFTDGFFEDFSDYRGRVFPREDHFTDRYAYINSSWADSMISLGVATLDACDQYGFPYYSSDSGVVSSDTLTSQPFEFPEGVPAALYFSFFYQAGGLGDLPEGILSDGSGEQGEDSLVVDFYAPGEDRWIQKFYTLDNTKPNQFNKVEIPLTDTFRMDGFRFRFRNYTSLPPLNQQGIDLGKFENDDMWHIDYIRLTDGPTDADTFQLGDIAITKPLLPSLQEYTTVPWKHYSLAQSTIERRNIPLTVQDFGTNYGGNIFFFRNFQTTDLGTGNELRTREWEREFTGFESYTFMDDFTTGFYFRSDTTVGVLEIKAYLETEAEQPRENDTVVRKEVYFDHYAYDDGTAEAGFGIDGEYQDLSKIGLRFRAFTPTNTTDTLRAILLYFVKSIDSVSSYAEYQIEIRKNDGLKPADETLYISDIYSPDYSKGINEFTRIEIDPPLLISDTFFVVIHQLDGYLNIGYDINTDNAHKLYTYINQEWIKPVNLTAGTPMIRASFGKYSLPTAIESPVLTGSFRVFPNPAEDLIRLDFPDEETQSLLIQVYSMTGALQLSELTDQQSLSIEGLRSGIYLISASTTDGKKRYTTKFIKK
ncbi:MAG: T9SS type A sorting domain-containing protein [Bacteroidales bacterium]|nr:T9SS type A sorting domain-containing protein [Bacteroidales bacterium]